MRNSCVVSGREGEEVRHEKSSSWRGYLGHREGKRRECQCNMAVSPVSPENGYAQCGVA